MVSSLEMEKHKTNKDTLSKNISWHTVLYLSFCVVIMKGFGW